MARKQTTIEAQADEVARRVFGYPSLHESQRAAVTAVMEGRDAWVNQATGFGKSACYQIPACMIDGMVLVFSPLIALMKDQVDKMRRLGLRCERLASDMPQFQVAEIERNLKKLDLLYVAPERLKNADFLGRLRRARVSLIAIDEAHVLSQSMRDFRPAYSLIGSLVQRYFPQVPRIALTATADGFVERDVVRVLGMREYVRVVGAPHRPNLRLEVMRDMADAQIANTIKIWRKDEDDMRGIVYASTRARVEGLARYFQSVGLVAKPYHAGLGAEVRSETQDAFVHGSLPVVVATNAFGMGIDKPDVRFVLHADMPRDIYAYVQEAGRAGRDGLPSNCLLNISRDGLRSSEFFVRTSNPDIFMFNTVWDHLRRRPDADDGFRLSSRKVGQWIAGGGQGGVSAYDAPHYVGSLLGYLEYVGAIATKPDKTVYHATIQDASRFADAIERHEDAIAVRPGGGACKITIYAGDYDFVPPLLARGVLKKDGEPDVIVKCRLKREEHGVRDIDLKEKREAAERRLSLLTQYAQSKDRHAFIADVFGPTRVETVACSGGSEISSPPATQGTSVPAADAPPPSPQTSPPPFSPQTSPAPGSGPATQLTLPFKQPRARRQETSR